MFRQLANNLVLGGMAPPAAADVVLSTDARVLSHLVESAWDARIQGANVAALGFPSAPSAVAFPLVFLGRNVYLGPHLIYAYCIEATGVHDALAAVVRHFTTGERLGIPQNAATHAWLATTEELFFKDGSPFTPHSTISRLRPDINASRRQAYWRFFGMDLPGRDGGQPYPYDKPDAANRDFVNALESLLRELWRAAENVNNFIGPNATDPNSILDLVVRLQDMLIARRGGQRAAPVGPNLAREEHLYVAALAWMHLTVEFNTAVMIDLRATAPSPEDRLRIVGERVGIATHRQSHSFFLLGDALSQLLTNIELGVHSNLPGAQALFLPGAPANNVLLIINQWSKATGRDLKAPAVYVTRAGGTPAPAAIPATAAAPVGVPVASANGQGPVPAGSVRT